MRLQLVERLPLCYTKDFRLAITIMTSHQHFFFEGTIPHHNRLYAAFRFPCPISDDENAPYSKI